MPETVLLNAAGWHAHLLSRKAKRVSLARWMFNRLRWEMVSILVPTHRGPLWVACLPHGAPLTRPRPARRSRDRVPVVHRSAAPSAALSVPPERTCLRRRAG